MSRHERNTLMVILALLVLGFLLFSLLRSGTPTPAQPFGTPASTTTAASSGSAAASSLSSASASSKSSSSAAASSAKPVPTVSTPPIAPTIKLHKELIPKDISIVRCYYAQEVAPPGVTFGFDINGSGFTSEFQKMIKVESGVEGIEIRNLTLVTANQIHGSMVVGKSAKTAFVYPRVLIKNLPVFSAPDPFAVVRKGEVLTIIFISMENSGRAGRFRVVTNLDDELAKSFRVEPSTAGLDISDLSAELPYIMEGTLRIGQRMPPGEYGLVITIGGKPVFRRDGMIKIVRPNVGQSGFVQGVMAADKFHRPSDRIELYLQGTGMSPDDITVLDAKVDEFDMGKGSFTFISGVQMRLSFNIPPAAPPRSYSVSVLGGQKQVLVDKKDVFYVVEPNWIAGVQVAPAVKPGGKALLRILGRDFTTDFAHALKIELDEPGIHLQPLERLDANTLAAEIGVDAAVAPGDYWLQLSADGKKISPPYGSIIKVQPK